MTSSTRPVFHGRRRTLAAAVLAVALPAALVFGDALPASASASAPAHAVASASASAAAAGNAGTPGAPVSLFTENFENGTAGLPVSLDAYTGAAPTDETYSADPAWLAAGNCNGLIVSEQDPVAQPAGIACNGFWSDALAFGAAFGTWEGTDASTNHALVGYTDGSPGADKVELQTNTPIPLPSADRFLIVRGDAAAQNCGGVHPQFMFSVLDGATALPSFSAPIDPCDAYGTVVDGTYVGTYTGDRAALFGGSAAGIQLVNEQGGSVGNDAAVDDIQLLDATPQLDLSATSGSIPVGESADLTFTITNTSELDAKDGWSFTADLPTGLTLADDSSSTTCTSASAAPGSAAGTVDVGGDLASGQSSCTVTVHVTSVYGGTYQLCAGQITNAVGVNLPGCATLTFVAPVFDARAGAAGLTSPLLNLGPIAPSAYECKSAAGGTSNGVLSAGLGVVGSVGALTTTASGSIAADGTRTAAAGARTAKISLLAGLISADEASTTAQARQPLTSSGPGHVTTAGSTTFTNLRVGGVVIAANPGPDTTIGITGVGTVVLNEQTPIAGGDGVTVTALDLTLLTGTHLTISQSTAALLSSTATCPTN